MRVLARVQTLLQVALVVLGLGLIALVVGGVLLRPLPPVGFPAVDGQILLRQVGTGPALSSKAVRFGQHAVGIEIRCNGTGTIRVTLHPFGAAESSCEARDTTDGGYVLSNVPTSTTTWQVTTRPGNRWSLVLTEPVNDGATWSP